METKTKPERVKWVLEGNAIVAGGKVVMVVSDQGAARQIVHEHNTWGELLQRLRDIVNCPDCRDIATHEMTNARAALAAAEKEEG